jgi:peptide/nickel transport system permease protein
LNGRLDVTWDAIRHLILPVISLGLLNWAVLARIARVSTMEEFHKEHIIAAKARGIPENRLVNKHILRNIISPSLTSSALGATTLFTGAIVIEHTFSLKGISSLMESINAIPDVTSVMGFAVFCILCVLGIMFILDVVQAIVDPRIRDGVLEK